MVKERVFKGVTFGFFYFLCFFLFYFVIPMKILSILFPIVGLLLCWWLWKKNQKQLAIVYLALTALMVIVSIASFQSLAIIYNLDIQDILEYAAMGIAIGYYVRFWPLFLLIGILMLIAMLYAVFTRTESVWKVALWIGYSFIIIVVTYNVIVILFPQEWYEYLISIVGFGAAPLELYYTMDVAIWIMSGFSFVAEYMSGIVNSVSGAGE